MKTLRIAAVASLALAPVALAAPAHAADATVSILHAVPGATVDVYANGKALLTNFKPGTLTDPLMLPEGTYDLKVTAAGAGAGGAAVIEANDVKVPGDANVTVVAHLDEAGKPVLTPFVNDTSTIAAGKARITVRHTAAAPAVDVRANGDGGLQGPHQPQRGQGRPRRRHDQAPTSSSPAPTPSRSARPTSTSRRAPTRSSTPGAAPPTRTSPSRPRRSPACTPPRVASPPVRG